MKNRKILFILFCLVLVSILSLTLAYAALSSNLTISGSADVVASTWNVHFENAKQVSTVSNNLYDYEVSPLAIWECEPQAGIDCIKIDSDLKLIFSTSSLSAPGDVRKFSFEVVNSGSIDAKLDSSILDGLSTEQDEYINYYVKYEDGSNVSSGDILTAGNKKTLLLVVEFDENVSVEQLPTANQNISLSYTMNYVQVD